MANDNLYFAQKSADETILVLQDKTEKWFQNIETTGYLDLIINSWTAYHGAYYNQDGSSHSISFGGEQGELTQIAVNHYRNIARNMLNIITATRPSMNAQAINTDQKSISQTILANNLLDYYMTDHKLEEFIKTATEEAIVMASGYVMVEWDSTKGEAIDVDDDTGEEIRQGDLEFTSVNMLNVVFDTNREDRKHDWVVVRTFKNRFDVSAKYPEFEEKILALPTKDKLKQFSGFNSSNNDDTDLIPVYRFFHKRTDAMPAGRYLMYLDHDIPLLDSPMPYRDLPVYCIAPSYYLGTVYPYSDMFDLLPLQDALNSVYSTMLTNITTFGVQHLVVPNNANVTMSELSSGLSVISANESQGSQVRGLNLTTQPDGIFDVISTFEKAMETISGVNAVSRGNPDPSLRSGNALALVQSMTLQFLSGLQASYVLLIENLGTGVINILKDHANVPRMVNIVGKNKKSYIKEFTGDSLGSVDRVKVKIGNPLANSTAGKVEMAEQLLQMGVIDNAKDYISVMETGNLDVMTEDVTSQLNLMRDENERLMDGKPVRAIFTDAHAMHIKEHASVINDTDLRMDNDLVARVAAHIQEHIDLLRSTDPDMLNLMGEVPLPPVAPPPQMGPPQGQPQQGAPQEQQGPPPGPQMPPTDPLSQQMAMPQNPLPNPPQVNPELLPNPELQVQQQATLQAMQPGPR